MQPGHSTFYTSSSCESPVSLSSADSGHSSLLMSLDSSSSKPFRSFRSTDQYLIAMKEDLADWLNQLYSLDVNVENFINSLENGVLLCRHANNLMRRARSLSESGATVPKYFLQPSCTSSPSPGGKVNLKSSPSTSAISSAAIWSPLVEKNNSNSNNNNNNNNNNSSSSNNNSRVNRSSSNTPGSVKRKEDTVNEITTTVIPVVKDTESTVKKIPVAIAPSVNTSCMTRKSLLPRSTSSFNSHRSSSSTSSSFSSPLMANCKVINRNNNITNNTGNGSNHSTSKNNTPINNNNDINYNNNITANNNYNKFNSTDNNEFNSLSIRLASSSFRSSSTSTSSSSLSDQTIDTDDSANSKSTASVNLTLNDDENNTQVKPLSTVTSSSASSTSSSSSAVTESTVRSTFQTVQASFAIVSSSSSNCSSFVSTRSPLTKSVSSQNFKSSASPHTSSCNRFAVKNNDDTKKVPFEINYWKSAKAQSFYARDNICSFLTFCRSIGIRECLLFECEDLVSAKNEKSVILCLLEVARKGAQLGMKIPLLIQMEQEIDKEIEQDEAAARQHDDDSVVVTHDDTFDNNCDNSRQTNHSHVNVHNNDFDSQYNSETDSTDSTSMQQIVTNDLKSLHELVVDLLNRCTCPQQYPMIKVADGKYRIGDTKTLIFVRILRKVIMVRVGGGWDTLEHYLDKHDPCRCYYAYNSRRKSAASVASTRNRF